MIMIKKNTILSHHRTAQKSKIAPKKTTPRLKVRAKSCADAKIPGPLITYLIVKCNRFQCKYGVCIIPCPIFVPGTMIGLSRSFGTR